MVELNEFSHWFWDAPKDAHGTTMNSLALGHPASYKGYIRDEEANKRAQWTRVFVMPHSVVMAGKRVESKK